MFHGSCLKQDKVTYKHRTVVNIYIVYELSSTLNSFDPTLENYLFGAVKITKNTDIDKSRFSGYGIGFDSKGIFVFPNGECACIVILFGTDMSSFVHVDNTKKDILIFGEGATQGLDGTILTAEESIRINFIKSRKKFCLSLYYSGSDSPLFVNGTEICKFRAKNCEIVAMSLCLGDISKDFFEDNFYGCVYGFSADYEPIAVDDMLDIYKYLMKKNVWLY